MKNKWIEYLKDNERKYNDGLKKLHTAIDNMETIIRLQKNLKLLKQIWNHLHDTTKQSDFDKLVNSLTQEQRLFLMDMDLIDNE